PVGHGLYLSPYLPSLKLSSLQMDSIDSELVDLYEEYPLLEEARYAWTLHSIWRLMGEMRSADLRVHILRMRMRRKAEEVIHDANSYRMVTTGSTDNGDFFIHPDLLKQKIDVEEKIQRKKRMDHDRRIAERFWIEEAQKMRRQIRMEKEMKIAEEEQANEQKLRDSMKSLRLEECDQKEDESASIEMSLKKDIYKRKANQNGRKVNNERPIVRLSRKEKHENRHSLRDSAVTREENQENFEQEDEDDRIIPEL
ncbi:hypothetical protein PENTCL1PPCAC_27881, partial [Pristionchus entomophagus]